MESDDGSEISAVLGMPSIPIDRMHVRAAPHQEILFRAGITECQDLNLLGILDHIQGPSLLLTGIPGQIWHTDTTLGGWDPGETLARWDQGGYGLGEVRIRAGFSQAPVPFLGARRFSDILAITESR